MHTLTQMRYKGSVLSKLWRYKSVHELNPSQKSNNTANFLTCISCLLARTSNGTPSSTGFLIILSNTNNYKRHLPNASLDSSKRSLSAESTT